MQKLIVTQGLPASGKTTWSHNWVKEEPTDRVRVNRDDIRKMLGPYWIPSREKLVTDIENGMVRAALKRGFSVVVDATNFKPQKWMEMAITYGIKLEMQDFTNVSLKECIQRDQQRKESVGKQVIEDMYNKYLK